MSIPAAYIGVILIWTTTPLAIKWSGESAGFLFGVTGRMVIGVVLASALLYLSGKRLLWHRKARATYMAGGLGIYGAMSLVYWGVQFIPSGWVSIIFGLSPVITGVLAAIWLQESALTPTRLLGMFLGLSGLFLVFAEGVEVSLQSTLGIVAVVLSTLVHSFSTVWVKKIAAALPGMTITTGSLVVAVLLFLLTWFVTGAQWPQHLSQRSVGAIVYLGVIGSVLGFALYFYVLTHVQATRVSLITLITPVTALLLGAIFNDEVISLQVWLGVSVISLGLVVFQWGGLFRQWALLRVRR
ncbi:MAG: DMT family transporter [Chromatiales bacterium]